MGVVRGTEEWVQGEGLTNGCRERDCRMGVVRDCSMGVVRDCSIGVVRGTAVWVW